MTSFIGIPKEIPEEDVEEKVCNKNEKKKVKKFREFTSDEKKLLANEDLSNGFNQLQLEAFAIMRNELKDELAEIPQYEELVSDYRFLRFLRGHLFNIKVACAMYRRMLRWRKLNEVDAIREEIVSKNMQPDQFPHYGRIARYYPSDMNYGVDREGRPLHIELCGRANPKKMQSSFSIDEWMRYTIYCGEYNSIRLHRLSVEAKKLVKVSVIYDMAGASSAHMSKMAIDTAKAGIRITSDNYPEIMHSCMIINAPTVFSLAWKLIKPWLAERTIKKIKILGSGYSKTLLEHVAPDNLPIELGGTKEEQFPLLFSAVSVQSLDEDYSFVEVSKVERVSLKVDASHYVLWGYYTETGNIKATANYSGTKFETLEDVESKEDATMKFQSDALCGSFVSSTEGVFTIEFDNSGTFNRKKKINYYMFSVPLEDHREFESPKNGKLKSFFSDDF